jgi:hypothetical protein
VDTAHNLRQCLADLEQTNRTMRDLFERKPIDWKLGLVRLRRTQSAQLATLSECLIEWSGEALDEPSRTEVMRLFTDMRRSIALTQTEWPLSLINDAAALDAYSAASRRTIEASSAFFSWMKARLDAR